jgi:hypothetical protein
MSGRRPAAVAFLTWLVWIVPANGSIYAQEKDAENKVKAACLGNFGLFVIWPDKPAIGKPNEFQIGVLGSGATIGYLKTIAESKTIDGRRIVVNHFTSIDDYKPCHILFIPMKDADDKNVAAAERLAAAIQKVKGSPVLLVTESPGLQKKGAMLNFFVDDAGSVRFEANTESAKASGLQFKAGLLSIARAAPP